ncbi:hypothetical protein V8D89_010190 [Ganoderma adspersum]
MASLPALVDAISTLLNAQSGAFATFTFVTYDWLINLDEEFHWSQDIHKSRKLNAAVLLYALNRYPTIIKAVLQLRTISSMSDMAYGLHLIVMMTGSTPTNNRRSCQIISRAQIASNILLLLVSAIFSTIRVYALSTSNKFIAITTFLLLSVPGVTFAVLNTTNKVAVLRSPFNCSVVKDVSISEGVTNSCAITTIAGDFLVLFVTWRKTYSSYRAQTAAALNGPSLVRVMLYNGSTYFIAITAMNILSVILSQVASIPAIANIGADNIAPLTAVLTCRFLLDLRQADRTPTTASSPSAVPSLNFAAGFEGSGGTLPAFIASMGSVVYTGLRLVDSRAEDEANVDMSERGSREGTSTLPNGEAEEDGIEMVPYASETGGAC